MSTAFRADEPRTARSTASSPSWARRKPVTFDVELVGAGKGFAGQPRMGVHARAAINPRISACRRCWAMRSRSWSTPNSRGSHERRAEAGRRRARADARPQGAARARVRRLDRRPAGGALVGAAGLHAGVVRDGCASGRRLASPHARARRQRRHQAWRLSRGRGARASRFTYNTDSADGTSIPRRW